MGEIHLIVHHSERKKYIAFSRIIELVWGVASEIEFSSLRILNILGEVCKEVSFSREMYKIVYQV